MTPSNVPDDHLINWNTGEDGVAEEFIVSANGRTARKYEGDYDDIQAVIEWVEKSGGSAKPEDSDAEWKKLHVTNPDGSVLELQPDQYLVLHDGQFSSEPESTYEPDPWEGANDLPPMEK